MTTLRPSGAARWIACPGSVALCADIPEKPSHRVTKEGTAAHSVAEYCLTNGQWDATPHHGNWLEVENEHIEVNQTMVDGVNVYLNAIAEVLRPEDHLYVERRVTAVSDRLDFSVEGTSDCFIWKRNEKHLYVFDLKYGLGLVEVENNKQELTYMTGAIQHLIADGEGMPEKISLCIVQPRGQHADGPVRFWHIDLFQYLDFQAELIEAVDAIAVADPALGITAPLSTGKHCKYCPAAEHDKCPLQKEAFDKVFTEIVPPSAVEGFDAAELGRRLDQADEVELYIANLRARAEETARTGNLPTGRKWVLGRGSRDWAHDDGYTIEALQFRAGVDVSQRICPSPAQVEKELGKKRFSELAAGDPQKGWPALVNKKSGKPRLVKETDKGDAINILEYHGDNSTFEALDYGE